MNKKIINVTIEPGCVSCGACQAICPEVFELRGMSKIKPDASFEKNAALIREAAETCPVSVIVIEEQ